MAVNPGDEGLRRFLGEDDGEPVVMLNLLRFAEGGQALYSEYSKRAAPFLARYGGTLLYAGQGRDALVAEAGQAWDAVLVIRYPSRDAFLQMIADPGYLEVAALRERALAEAVLQPTSAWPGSP
ncbi:DUF1330 domain-containing protein [Actinocorallia aurea]